MPDRQAAAWVEELQVAGVYGQLERITLPGPALLGEARGPQRLTADQRGRGLVLVRRRLLGGYERSVVHMRRVDGEEHHDLTAELLGDTRRDAHCPAAGIAEAGILEVRWADAEDELLAEVVGEPRLAADDLGRDLEGVAGEGDRRAVVPDQLGGHEVHRGGADEPGYEQVDRRLEQVLRRVDLLQPPVQEHGYPVAERHGLDLVVRHVHGGDAEPVVQLVERGPHGDAQLGVQVAQWLVHQEGLRLADDGPAHRDPLPLPAGQRARLALEIRLQAQHLGRLIDPPLDLVLRRLAQLQAERQVLLDGHVRVQGVVLEHHGDVPVLGRQVVDHPVADRDGAAGDLLQTGDGPQRGRLAASGRADEHHELAVFDVQAEVVDGLDTACVRLFEVVKDYLCHGGVPFSDVVPAGLLGPGALRLVLAGRLCSKTN